MERLKIELDGPGVQPETVDAQALIALAGAYFALLQKIASVDLDEELGLQGIRIEDKCVAVSTLPSNDALALAAAQHLAYAMQGDAYGRHAGEFKALRKALDMLPSGYTARAMVGDWHQALEHTTEPLVSYPYAVTTLRVRLVRVGGTAPTAQFESGSEDDRFTLSMSEDLARQLAPLLYQELEATMTFTRDDRGKIRQGRLDSFEKLDEGNAFELWHTWFKGVEVNPNWEAERDDD
jgi:hypothetical protein